MSYLVMNIVLGRHDEGGESQASPTCGACKESVEHVVFDCAP